jgi:hypothetical protein
MKHDLRWKLIIQTQRSYCDDVESTASSMAFRDLPLEIQSRILEFCSPSDWAVLSRVHTSGRDMAEYSRIQYRARPSDLIIPSRDVESDESSQGLKEDRSLLHPTTPGRRQW